MKKFFVPFLLFCFFHANSQTFNCGTSTVADVDNNIYHTVQIGSQCWMKENMRVTRYANGQTVGLQELTNSTFHVTANMPGKLNLLVSLPKTTKLHVSVWNVMGKETYHEDLVCNVGNSRMECSIGPAGLYVLDVNGTTFKVIGSDHCVTGVIIDQSVSKFKSISDSTVITNNSRNFFDFNNDPALGVEYGKLYTLLSALNINTPPYPAIIQGICPDGWHVPNDSDFLKLEYTAGMSVSEASRIFKYRGTIGNKLKIIGPEWWDNAGTDDFGFSAKGSGIYHCTPQGCAFDWLTNSAYFWTYTTDWPMMRLFWAMETGIWRGLYTLNGAALSVRCLKN
jgi:uncharacterized protein (TIGR02145 family)